MKWQVNLTEFPVSIPEKQSNACTSVPGNELTSKNWILLSII